MTQSNQLKSNRPTGAGAHLSAVTQSLNGDFRSLIEIHKLTDWVEKQFAGYKKLISKGIHRLKVKEFEIIFQVNGI